jgi:hypothetical protein
MTHPPQGERASRGSHLDSWKQIAAYLKRDIRTVQRWEKLEGLPVHRHQHDERGTAYAYSAEIEEWLEQRRRRANDSASPVARAGKRVGRYAWGGAVALGTIALLIWAFSAGREQPDPLSVSSITFGQSEQFYEWGPDLALSPDGATLAYNVRSRYGQLHLRRRDQFASQPIPGTNPSHGPVFSPDGRWIAYFQGGVLKKIAVDGGIAVPLGAVGVEFLGAVDWGTDDHLIYANVTPAGTHGLYRVPADGGAATLIDELDGQAEDTYWLTPQSLAGGAAILCTIARTTASGARFQVVVVSVATGERRVLVDDAKHGLYVGDGILVYLQRESLVATSFDPVRLTVSGPRVPAWDGVGDRVRFRAFSYAAGTLVYWPTLRDQRRFAWVDRSGRAEPLPLPPALYSSPRLSPDGQTIAYKIGGEFGNIWTYSLVDGSTAQLTFDGRSGALTWTPDGTRLTVSTLGSAGDDLVQVRADGKEPTERLRQPLPAGFHKQPRAWLRGGRTLLVDVSARPSLWAVPFDGGEPRPVRNEHIDHGQVSPDERWIAYASGAPGRREVYVAPFLVGQAQWKVSSGGDLPVWAKSGRELFYRDGQHVMSVPIGAGDKFSAGSPRILFTGRYYEGEPGGPNYDVSLDGQRLLMVLSGSTDGPDRLNVVQGWKAEIERRLRASR